MWTAASRRSAPFLKPRWRLCAAPAQRRQRGLLTVKHRVSAESASVCKNNTRRSLPRSARMLPEDLAGGSRATRPHHRRLAADRGALPLTTEPRRFPPAVGRSRGHRELLHSRRPRAGARRCLGTFGFPARIRTHGLFRGLAATVKIFSGSWALLRHAQTRFRNCRRRKAAKCSRICVATACAVFCGLINPPALFCAARRMLPIIS